MRLVPQSLVDAFYSGDMTGDAKNMARVTVQHGGTKLFQLPYNLYASSVFGATDAPKELPNVKRVHWSRSKDQDFATATFEFYNTKPFALGDTATRDVDNPGYYTFTRGMTSFSKRWGQQSNDWQNMLMPDNILRSYEGYGFDGTVIPELDPFLVSTGVWRIDSVEYEANGLITVQCRDIGSILADQILFPPIVPKNFYPVSFTADLADKVGFIGPSVNTHTQDTSDVSQPSSWHGPTAGPHTCTVAVASDSIAVSWTRPSVADTPGGDTTKGYKVVGYQIAVDDIILPTVYKPTTFVGSLGSAQGIRNGNVYGVRVIALWQEVLTTNGQRYFKTTTEAKVRSDFSPEAIARPHSGGVGLPTVTPGSIALNVNAVPALDPGAVRFDYTNAGTYVVVAYRTGNTEPQKVFSADFTGSGTAVIETGTVLGDMTEWNYLVYGKSGSVIGPGDVFFAGINGAYHGAPSAGATPAKAPSLSTPSVQTSAGKVPIKSVPVKLSFSDNSNDYYVGAGANVSVYGHTPAMAFVDDASYWLSIGNDVNTAGYSYEWIEGSSPAMTLTSVVVHTKGKSYGLYLSVFADGKWVQHSDTGVIPYNPSLPESHNHANIPYAEFKSEGDTEGPVTIVLREPIPGVTKVRVTFHNLQYFTESDLHYRAACRFLEAIGQPGDVVAPTAGKVVSDGGPTSETTYTPAHVEPGLGAKPGKYQDYTDLIKLFCAWGGFYWPPDAEKVLSDGSVQTFSFGQGPYGLPNVDPVLGDIDGGRVWGDLEETGTAGIVPLPINVWSQQTLIDAITYVRNIIGFIFYVDEDGGIVWRRPNQYAIGNWVGDNASAGTPARISNCPILDEQTVLIGLRAVLNGQNVRERVFVATTDGKKAALAAGYNPNPTGLRRVGGWTDQYFSSQEECQVMADLIALQQLFSYRSDVVQIHGYPAVQVDDQVIVIEQVTSEGYYHYVSGIDSDNDLEQGGWTYDLTTNWLGARPFDQWAFDPAGLSKETQTYLQALNFGVPTTLPDGTV